MEGVAVFNAHHTTVPGVGEDAFLPQGVDAFVLPSGAVVFVASARAVGGLFRDEPPLQVVLPRGGLPGAVGEKRAATRCVVAVADRFEGVLFRNEPTRAVAVSLAMLPARA
jgi:hypothetical protein